MTSNRKKNKLAKEAEMSKCNPSEFFEKKAIETAKSNILVTVTVAEKVKILVSFFFRLFLALALVFARGLASIVIVLCLLSTGLTFVSYLHHHATLHYLKVLSLYGILATLIFGVLLTFWLELKEAFNYITLKFNGRKK